MNWQLWMALVMLLVMFGIAAIPHFAVLFLVIIAVFGVLFTVLGITKKDNNVS